MNGVKVNPELCTGCGECVEVCGMEAVKLVDGKAVVGPDCVACLACVDVCPSGAIEAPKPEWAERPLPGPTSSAGVAARPRTPSGPAGPLPKTGRSGLWDRLESLLDFIPWRPGLGAERGARMGQGGGRGRGWGRGQGRSQGSGQGAGRGRGRGRGRGLGRGR